MIQNGPVALNDHKFNRCELPAACLVGPSRNLQSEQDFPSLQSNAWKPGKDYESPMNRPRIQQALETGGAQFISQNGGEAVKHF
jgi:hypothetical protein